MIKFSGKKIERIQNVRAGGVNYFYVRKGFIEEMISDKA